MNNTLNDIVSMDVNTSIQNKASTPQAIPAGAEYDYVVSFFESVMKDRFAAESFTQSVYEISRITDTSVLSIMQTFDGQDLMTLTMTMALYLNSIRSQTTLLGVQSVVKPNYYAGRNVVI
jgi:hypothetical protein